MEKRNRLSEEKSPYLLQHQHNPVNWYSWGEDAFRASREEEKPIFLSIGYSTCYWCHVMEKDSFESDDVASVMNEKYICVKIDREERPDIDKIYMDAVVAMTGQGGWPLSIWLTPELQPFYGGTFFPQVQFVQLLEKIDSIWNKERDRVLESAGGITTALQVVEPPPEEETKLNSEILKKSYHQLKNIFDITHGGFGGAPKFPPSVNLMVLLRIFRRSEQENALSMASITLEKMARGGMYDHLGGGFARYSTDAKWLIPHFEKMLYDNALLSIAYLEGYQVTKNELFASVARETLDYVLGEMQDTSGGFYSAQDAGDVGREGEYYVWTEAELDGLLSDAEYEEIKRLYGTSVEGNFEDSFNVLNLQAGVPWSDKLDEPAASAHEKLLKTRKARRAPHKDDKVLTAWNALMISAMCRGYRVLEEKRFLEAAKQSAQFIKDKLYIDGNLLRRYRDGDARFPGYLDDYAYLVQALLDLYESSFEKEYFDWAVQLQARLDESFWDSEKGGYFYTEDADPSVIIRKKDFTDGATPSGSGVSALSLQRLYLLTGESSYRSRVEELFTAMAGLLNQFPSALASSLVALDFHLDRSKEIIIARKQADEESDTLIQHVFQNFTPSAVLVVGEAADLDDEAATPVLRGKEIREGKVTFYICENGACKAPTTSSEEAIMLLQDFESFEL